MKIACISDTTYRSCCPDFYNNLSFYGSESAHCVIAKGLSEAGHDVHFFAPQGSQDDFGTFHPLACYNGTFAENEILDDTSLERLKVSYLADFDFVLDFSAVARNIEDLRNYHGFTNYGVFRNGYNGYVVPRLRMADRNYIVPSKQNQRIFEKHGFADVTVCVTGDTVVDYTDLLAIHQNKPKTNTIVEISTDDYELKCTPDHRILTQRGWIQAKDLIARTDYCYTSGYESNMDKGRGRIPVKILFNSYNGTIKDGTRKTVSSHKTESPQDGIEEEALLRIHGNTQTFITGLGKSIHSWDNRWRRPYNSINDKRQEWELQQINSSCRSSQFISRTLSFLDKQAQYQGLLRIAPCYSQWKNNRNEKAYFADESHWTQKDSRFTRNDYSISSCKEETGRINDTISKHEVGEKQIQNNNPRRNNYSITDSGIKYKANRVNSIRFKRIDKEIERVYDLSTLNHTFFANNILVHNCYYGIPDFYCKGEDKEYIDNLWGDGYCRVITDLGYYDYFLYPHRPTQEKGSYHVLELAKHFPQETFVFMVSNNPVTQHKNALLDLKRLAVSLNLQNVKFVELPLNNKHHYYKRELMRHAKAVLSPFNPNVYLEGFGLANAEPVACGTPILVSDSESSRELWINEKDGLIIPYDENMYGFKMAIRNLGSYDFDPQNKFSVQDCINNYSSFIKNIMEKNDKNE